MTLRLGYNTNGFSNHALSDVIDIVSTLGYDGLAIALDHAHCNPFTMSADAITSLRQSLKSRNLSVVIETGARFLLDKWQKHEPTLVSSSGRKQRISFLKKAIDIARQLDAEVVTFFSGIKKSDVTHAEAERFFLEGCAEVLAYGQEKGVVLGLEPEPGMFVDSMSRFEEIERQLDHPWLKLTLDIGHLFCTEPAGSEADIIEQFGSGIVTMHIEDIRNREHFHLPFGDGTINFEPIFRTITHLDYQGLITVELSRDSHRAPDAARQSMDFLQNMISSLRERDGS